jgi:hypothetical protein
VDGVLQVTDVLLTVDLKMERAGDFARARDVFDLAEAHCFVTASLKGQVHIDRESVRSGRPRRSARALK